MTLDGLIYFNNVFEDKIAIKRHLNYQVTTEIYSIPGSGLGVEQYNTIIIGEGHGPYDEGISYANSGNVSFMMRDPNKALDEMRN